MTLYDLIQRIIDAASKQPAVRTICCGRVTKLNTIPDIDYGVFAYEQGSHRANGDNMQWVFRFFYIDRLDEAHGNVEMIQSDGVGVIENVLSMLKEQAVGVVAVTYTPLDMKFSDECALMMATVDLSTPKLFLCEEEYDEQSVKLI